MSAPEKSLKQKRLSYTIELKLKVVEYAKIHGNRAAERKFGPSESQVRWWRKQESQLLKRDKSKKNLRVNSAKWPLIEKMVKDWVEAHGKHGLPVTTNMVLFAARRVAYLNGLTDFVGTVSWCQRFLKRHGFDRFKMNSEDTNDCLASGTSSGGNSKYVLDARSIRGCVPKDNEAGKHVDEIQLVDLASTDTDSDCEDENKDDGEDVDIEDDVDDGEDVDIEDDVDDGEDVDIEDEDDEVVVLEVKEYLP